MRPPFAAAHELTPGVRPPFAVAHELTPGVRPPFAAAHGLTRGVRLASPCLQFHVSIFFHLFEGLQSYVQVSFRMIDALQ